MLRNSSLNIPSAFRIHWPNLQAQFMVQLHTFSVLQIFMEKRDLLFLLQEPEEIVLDGYNLGKTYLGFL
jgi:hypothetical protein